MRFTPAAVLFWMAGRNAPEETTVSHHIHLGREDPYGSLTRFESNRWGDSGSLGRDRNAGSRGRILNHRRSWTLIRQPPLAETAAEERLEGTRLSRSRGDRTGVLGEGLLEEEKWSGRVDSNHRPPHPQRGALPNCATARLLICLVARSWMLVIVSLPSRLPNTFILFF